MYRSRSITAALFALLAPTALGSCVDDSVSLRITCNMAPSDDCEYAEGNECWVSGRLNLAIASSYRAVLRVTNGLKSREREVPPLSETNGIQIYQLEIEVKDTAGNKIGFGRNPNPFTVPASGFIEPNSEGWVGGELLPSTYVKELVTLHTSGKVNTLSLSVLARGKTSGDVEVESGKWPWYISLASASSDPIKRECRPSEDDVCAWGQDGDAFVCAPEPEN